MRMRVQFAKEGLLRFLSHLDVQRTLMRAFRRAGLPVAYTQGFNPHPRISFGSVLATGASSEAEFFDLDLAERMDPDQFVAALNRVLPQGLRVVAAREVPEGRQSLMSLLNAAKYRLTLELGSVDPQALRRAVDAFLQRETVTMQREGKKGSAAVDVRRQVYDVIVEGTNTLLATLQAGPEGSLRPADLLAALKQVAPELEPVRLVQVHRVAALRRDPATGRFQLPWDL
ncbi:MAG TPA: TIGR03936 family radical SAM-associated protein [Symbiobacteriaceae bacterium]